MSGPHEPEQPDVEPDVPGAGEGGEPEAAPEAAEPRPVDDAGAEAQHGRHAGEHAAGHDASPDADVPAHHAAHHASRTAPEPAGETADPDAQAEEPAPATPAPAADRAAGSGSLLGWSGLRSLLRPRLNTSQLIVAVLCAALGFALIVQVHQNQSDNLSSLRQSDLVRLLDDVTQRTQTLEREQSDLTATRDELKSATGSQQAAIDLATERAQTQGILSGRLPATGPGIRLTIKQSTQTVGAATMFNVLEELRNAGAEAIQVNDVRLVASSWFEVHGDTLVADGQPLESPYVWRAIGDPDTLAPALGIPGGALAAVRNTGATAEVSTSKKIDVTATREPGTPQYATPTPLATRGGS